MNSDWKKTVFLLSIMAPAACSKHSFFKTGNLSDGLILKPAAFMEMRAKIPAYGIVINKDGRKELEVNIEAGDTKSLKVGQEAKAFIGALKTPVPARVARVLRAVSSETGQSLAWLIPLKKFQISPGQFVTAWIYTSRKKKVVAIPKSAILIRNGKKLIVVKAGDDYRVQEIKTGISSDKKIEILSGIQPGDQILTQGGLFFLYPNFKAVDD